MLRSPSVKLLSLLSSGCGLMLDAQAGDQGGGSDDLGVADGSFDRGGADRDTDRMRVDLTLGDVSQLDGGDDASVDGQERDQMIADVSSVDGQEGDHVAADAFNVDAADGDDGSTGSTVDYMRSWTGCSGGPESSGCSNDLSQVTVTVSGSSSGQLLLLAIGTKPATLGGAGMVSGLGVTWTRAHMFQRATRAQTGVELWYAWSAASFSGPVQAHFAIRPEAVAAVLAAYSGVSTAWPFDATVSANTNMGLCPPVGNDSSCPAVLLTTSVPTRVVSAVAWKSVGDGFGPESGFELRDQRIAPIGAGADANVAIVDGWFPAGTVRAGGILRTGDSDWSVIAVGLRPR